MFLPALLLAATAALTSAQIDGMVDKAERAFHAYAFPDVAAKAIHVLQSNRKKYEGLSDPKAFRKAINADLYSVTHDKHVSVWYPFDPQDATEDDSAAAIEARHQDDLESNFGFATIRRLRGNVGYLRFDYFSDDADVGSTIAAAMRFLANTDALIIDLRRNGGGSTVAAQTLEAYFFKSQQPITSIKWRDEKTGVVSEQQQYTAATVPGPLYVGKPVYLLTDGKTFSCAEQFTYDLHNLHRVTIVGETTGGGANPGDVHDLGNGFGIFMPQGYAYSPVTKTNWEGTGIAPDVNVPASDALKRAYDLALAHIKGHSQNKNVLEEVSEALNDENAALATQP